LFAGDDLLKGRNPLGDLQPGDQIVEGKLAQQLGVGQGLIREALIDLEHQGFLQRSPFSWTQVPTFTNKDAEQIFEIRIRVEPLAFSAGRRQSDANGCPAESLIDTIIFFKIIV
jgi:DNA-binding GntR family transcriptional regulator